MIIQMIVCALSWTCAVIGFNVAGPVGMIAGGGSTFLLLQLLGEKVDGRRVTKGFWLRQRATFLPYMLGFVGGAVGFALSPNWLGAMAFFGGMFIGIFISEGLGWSGDTFLSRMEIGRKYVTVLVSAACADGSISAKEKTEISRVTRQIMTCFGYQEDHDIEEFISISLQYNLSPRWSGQIIQELPPALRDVIQFDVMRILWSDGNLSEGDRLWLTECMNNSGMADWSGLRFYDREIRHNDVSQRTSRQAWLEELGLTEGANEMQIKTAYRRKSLDYHPDRLPPSVPPQVRALAESKMMRINEAYHNLVKAPGQSSLNLYFKTRGTETSFSPTASGLFICDCWQCHKVNRVAECADIKSARCGQCYALLGLSSDPLQEA